MGRSAEGAPEAGSALLGDRVDRRTTVHFSGPSRVHTVWPPILGAASPAVNL